MSIRSTRLGELPSVSLLSWSRGGLVKVTESCSGISVCDGSGSGSSKSSDSDSSDSDSDFSDNNFID